MHSNTPMLRRALMGIAVVAICAPVCITAPAPAAASNTGLVQPEPLSAQEVFVKAKTLGQQLTRAQLDLHDALVRTNQPAQRPALTALAMKQRSEVLESLNLLSSNALRAAAATLRMQEVRRASLTPSTTGSALPSPAPAGSPAPLFSLSVSQARRAVAALYPWAAASIRDKDIPAVLEAAAAEHDRLALHLAEASPQAELVPLSSLTAGEMIVRAARVAKPASLSHQLSTVERLHSWYVVALKDAARAAFHTSYQAASRRAERIGADIPALEDFIAAVGRPPSNKPVSERSATSDLVTAWEHAGYRRTNAVLTALAQVGKTYRFANRGPDAFDCSGLTSYAWASSALDLRPYSFSQRAQVDSLGYAPPDARPGDLVFYKAVVDRDGVPSGHVAMVLGYGTLVVEAQSRADQVQVAPLVRTRLSSFGRVRLAGERTDKLLLPTPRPTS